MRILLLIVFLITGNCSLAQVLSTTRTTNWKKAKHIGAYFEPSLTVNILQYGGNNNGAIANDAALIAAVNALNGMPGIIYLPAGNYLFNNTINLRDSLILRGSGTNTVLTFSFNNASKHCITISGSVMGGWVSVGSGLRKNSKWIKPAVITSFKVGDLLEMRQLNGSWDTQPVAWAQYAVGQILYVDSIKNDKLYFHEKLRIDYDTLLQPQVARLKPRKSVGVECLKITRTDSNAAGNNYGVFLNKAYNCWIKNVTIEKMISAHVCITTSARCEITGSYITDAYSFDGSNTHGYGVLINEHACENKIENNVFKKLRHAITCKQGANGNVIAYNYVTQPTRTEFPTDAGADLLLHGHYPFLNLFEGNICQNIQADQTWGPNGPYNTFMRNRADGYGLIITSGSISTNNQNIIANDITNTGFLKG
ncbi:MAG TPA: glycosyl hydrolase family 28-related protein, partial [Bacteroidia bacterium]|nr:glycosyl hydrolase family 28-related protein [Bacteroidia bacterium]